MERRLADLPPALLIAVLIAGAPVSAQVVPAPVVELPSAPMPAPVMTPPQAPVAMPQAPEPEQPQPPVEAASTIPHISGGVGASEREEMALVKEDYNLRLLFAVAGSGEYLASIGVQIADGAGNRLLAALADGPYFYARLSPGRYALTVDNEGDVQTREVSVPAQGAVSLAFYWPGPVAAGASGQ